MKQEQPWRLQLLGAFQINAPDGRHVVIKSRKGRAIIAMLAAARHGERSRAWLQSCLWGSRAAKQASSSLRRELSTLRKLFHNFEQDSKTSPLLISDNHSIRLDCDQITIDFQLLQGNAADTDRAAEIAPAAEYGEFLEGMDISGEEQFEDWLREQRASAADRVEQLAIAQWQAKMRDRQNGARPIPENKKAQSQNFSTSGGSSAAARPSIAILPLANLSGDTDADMICDGIAEGVSTSLSRYPTLLVITAEQQSPKPQDATNYTKLCRDLDVRYVLTGSLQIAGEAVRLTFRLIDGVELEQLWAQQVDGALEDIFDLQDQVVDSIAPIVDSTIEKLERKKALERPVEHSDSYNLYWRANAQFRKWEPDRITEAIELAQQVLELEPENSWALSLCAFCHAVRLNQGWSQDRCASRNKAMVYFEEALEKGGEDPFVLGYAAGALVMLSENPDLADRLVTRALKLHPNMASTLFWGGWVDLVQGNYTRACERLELALRLNPGSGVRPLTLSGIGICRLMRGEIAEALDLLNEADLSGGNYPPKLAGLSAAWLMSGNQKKAGEYAARLRDSGGAQSIINMIQEPRLKSVMEGIVKIAS